MHVYSDCSWKGRQNAILHDSVYNGEFFDSRYDRQHWAEVGFNDSLSLWLPAEGMPSPLNTTQKGQLVIQDMLPIRAGSDALHFEVKTELDSDYWPLDKMTKTQGRSLTDGGILKPILTWTPTIGL